MLRMLSAMLAFYVSACATDVRDTALENLDLGDRKTLQALQDQVPLDQRGALATYALLHWPQSRFYCGQPIDPARPVPRTIGEAIDQTLAFEARRVRTLAASRAPVDALDRLVKRKQEAITRIDMLLLQRDMLKSRLGPGAADSPEFRALASQIEDARGELERIRDDMPAQAALSARAEPSLPGR